MINKNKLNYFKGDVAEDDPVGNFSAEEVAKFDKLAQSWWDPNGKYKTALEFNRARVEYFIQQICIHYNRDHLQAFPLKDLHILDVGCGGGLVCEALAKAGAKVVGIDVSEVSIEVAKRHAIKSKLDIEYRHEHAQNTSKTDNNVYDVVINAEVIEHVPNKNNLVEQCSKLCKYDGCLIMATLNRTAKSYLVAIIGAEYIMRYLPVGTHSWHDFVTPLELNNMAALTNMKLVSQMGMSYSLLTKKWRLNTDLSVNYIQVYIPVPLEDARFRKSE